MSGTERVFKVLVIGEPKVGKTAFVARYCTKEWLTNYKATIGGELVHAFPSQLGVPGGGIEYRVQERKGPMESMQ